MRKGDKVIEEVSDRDESPDLNVSVKDEIQLTAAGGDSDIDMDKSKKNVKKKRLKSRINITYDD